MTDVHVIEHEADAGLDLLRGPLAGLDLRVVRAYDGDALPDIADVRRLVVLGGEINAYDDERAPYLPQLRALLASAIEQQVPTLGICLGAQLLAVAAGGQVHVAAPAGVEFGIVAVRFRPAAEQDPVLGPVVAALGRTVLAPALHADAIVELPPGATWLASSRHYPYQAFRLGSALGVQFHPEASGQTLARWVGNNDLDDPQRVADQWDAARVQLTSLTDTLGRAFAAQVLPR